MSPTTKLFVLTLLAAGLAAAASGQTAGTSQESASVSIQDSMNTSKALPGDSSLTPVEQVRKNRSWEYGPFVNFGNGIGGDRSQYWFLSAGVELGKVLTPPLHAGFLSGQFELAGNVMPLWQAYTPGPHNQTFVYKGQTYVQPVGGGTYRGVSLTPVIFRWNFLTHTRRIQPWFQAAGGLIYTTHKFPPDVLVPHGLPGATSVWNFSPQGGFGVHYFTRPGRSIDICASGEHISSASLGDHNPGVNASWQIQLGYTFWR